MEGECKGECKGECTDNKGRDTDIHGLQTRGEGTLAYTKRLLTSRVKARSHTPSHTERLLQTKDEGTLSHTVAHRKTKTQLNESYHRGLTQETSLHLHKQLLSCVRGFVVSRQYLGLLGTDRTSPSVSRTLRRDDPRVVLRTK